MKTKQKIFLTALPLFVLIAIFAFFFFYRLGYPTLSSWDEAWYGAIARTMVKTGDYMNMMWNGQPFYDHPPLGFWLMALSYKVFGFSEFATRLPSALLSLGSIALTYLTGLQLFKKKTIAFVAALMLGTSVWYLIRVRSGNLDAILVFFYILTIYLALKSADRFALFPAVGVAFGGLMMSKTLVGLSALPLIVFINLRQLAKLKNAIWLALGVVGFLAVVYPWYHLQASEYPLFIEQHFFNVGLRQRSSLLTYFQLHPQLPLFYLHMGIRKWYYFWLLGGGFLLVSLAFLQKPVATVLLWNLLVFYPFLTTDKSQIWHLIPVYLPLVLIGAGGVYRLGGVCFRLAKKLVPAGLRRFFRETVFQSLYLLLFGAVALLQIKIFYPEVIPTTRYVPDDVAISEKIAAYPQTHYLDDDFLPIAVFYSGASIKPLIEMPDEKRTLLRLFRSDEKNFVAITRNWAIDGLKVNSIPYKVLEKNNSFSIVSRP
ncbi:glycosyltransferase family 39 protein [Patescibacteria group bacterium]|nr:glycosyltransferase family 39 protein [Patescibacteria group bacterium]MCL5091441.1 glycosyltransferase family 39 protein [Patescibacteria group bacterium]